MVVGVLGEYHPPPSPPTPGKEEGVPARRGSDGKLRGRKRVSDPAPPLDSDIEVNTLSQCWKLSVFLYNIYLSRSPSLSHTNFHEVNITYLLFHCSVCLSGTWMKPSSFSILSSREPSPHDLARYVDTPFVICKKYAQYLITLWQQLIIR